MVDEVAQGLFYRVIYCSNHKLTRRAQGAVRLRRRFLAAQKQQKPLTLVGAGFHARPQNKFLPSALRQMEMAHECVTEGLVSN